MKEIQPVTIWYNGIMVAATIFNMTSISDNLVDSAKFYWQLFTRKKKYVRIHCRYKKKLN